MWNYKKRLPQIVGIIGTLACVIFFYKQPSFPTPDKLLIFLTLLFMAFGQGWALFKRLAPFVLILLIYEAFRGLAPELNTHVNFRAMVVVDKWLFWGTLPTVTLQHWWWHGHVQWYDFVFYLAYLLHFVLPLGLALVIWKKRPQYYWRYITTFLVLSVAGFMTYLLFPAAPPWMASKMGIIEPIERVSSHVFYALGITDFPSLYNKLSPNPVAAVPSLHAAYATVFALCVTVFFKPKKPGKKLNLASLRWLAWLHPLLIWVGTVYQGEHYAIDEILGILYAVAAYFAAPYVLRAVKWLLAKFLKFSRPLIAKILKPMIN